MSVGGPRTHTSSCLPPPDVPLSPAREWEVGERLLQDHSQTDGPADPPGERPQATLSLSGRVSGTPGADCEEQRHLQRFLHLFFLTFTYLPLVLGEEGSEGSSLVLFCDSEGVEDGNERGI